MQNQKSTYRWMLLLMAGALVLLTGFVGYWLTGQYRQAEARLRSDLEQEYRVVHGRMLDSLLMERIVAPSLSDSILIHISTDMGEGQPADKVLSQASVTVSHFTGDSIDISALPPFNSCEDSGSVLQKNDTLVFVKRLGEEQLVRSVRLFINETDARLKADSAVTLSRMQVDAGEFIGELDRHYDDLEWNFNLTNPDSNIFGQNAHGLIILKNLQTEGTPEISVSGYRLHLLGELWPQFLFALLLLGLSATAMIVAYRSLMRSDRLHRLSDDFIGNMSHELKTPVSTMKVALEALNTFDLKADPEVSREYLAMAAAEVKRLEGLIGKVLEQSRLEGGAGEAELKPAPLAEICQRAVKRMEKQTEASGATLSWQAPSDPCMICGDDIYIESVLINLIDNSLKYGGQGVHIRVTLTCNVDGTVLRLCDNGPGIPQAYRQQIFDKFFRIPTGDRHDVKGYGLGLHFAALVMQQHRGSIHQENLPEGGCAIVLQFPPCPA